MLVSTVALLYKKHISPYEKTFPQLAEFFENLPQTKYKLNRRTLLLVISPRQRNVEEAVPRQIQNEDI